MLDCRVRVAARASSARAVTSSAARAVLSSAAAAVRRRCASPRECREQTWEVLSAARENGLIKNLGVSNHLIYQIEELRALEKAPVSVNQLQYHPWVPSWQEDIAQHCRENGIQLMAYFSLGGAQNAGSVGVMETIAAIGKKHGASSHQVMLRWAVQTGLTVIPGTGNPAHMRQNINAYSFNLSAEDMAAITQLGQNKEMASKFMFIGGPSSDGPQL
ncbi:NADP-dependent oxidoreductase domain-containing protein [Baffinella frigidus]|nr:NADP-dependent oxidoreductase domain-containing protein [Cryptophyta sp. CCMP2293]